MKDKARLAFSALCDSLGLRMICGNKSHYIKKAYDIVFNAREELETTDDVEGLMKRTLETVNPLIEKANG